MVILAAAFRLVADQLPFVLPWNDTAPGITDYSAWNRAIAADERVSVDAQGHFQAAGERVRFLGMNFAGDSPFLPTNRAEAVAGRLAKFRIHCVRLHHLDAPWALSGGLIQCSLGHSRNLNAAQLDGLHYLVARLKAHGIYANINLLVGREFQAADGLPAEIETMDWKDQHVLGFFRGASLQLHQEYATKLLTRTNPYTEMTLAQDPAVAFVEIMNENGMVQKWFDGGLDRLPTAFARTLQERWNLWLAGWYADDAATAYTYEAKRDWI